MSEICKEPGHTGWIGKCLECFQEMSAQFEGQFADAVKAEQLEKINGWLTGAPPKEGK